LLFVDQLAFGARFSAIPRRKRELITGERQTSVGGACSCRGFRSRALVRGWLQRIPSGGPSLLPAGGHCLGNQPLGTQNGADQRRARAASCLPFCGRLCPERDRVHILRAPAMSGQDRLRSRGPNQDPSTRESEFAELRLPSSISVRPRRVGGTPVSRESPHMCRRGSACRMAGREAGRWHRRLAMCRSPARGASRSSGSRSRRVRR
jgi:hypothetical protein